MVEDVEELGAELQVCPLEGQAEVLVGREIQLIEVRASGNIASGIAEGCAGWHGKGKRI